MKKTKLTLEDIEYSIHSWMYLVFVAFFVLLYNLNKEKYWIYVSILVLIFYTISMFIEMNRLKKLREGKK